MYSNILKDFVLLKNKNKPIYIVLFFIIYFVPIFIFKDIGLIIINILTIFFSTALALPLFTEDQKDDWYYFSSTLPIKNNDIVLSRFISMGSIILIMSIFNLLIDLIFSSFYNEYSILVYLSVIALSIAISLIYMSLLIPSVYLAGINGNSIVLLILTVIFMFVQNILKTSLIIKIFSFPNIILFFFLFLFCLILLIISITVSLKIVKKMR